MNEKQISELKIHLAMSLAEKLCFRVSPFIKWVLNQNIPCNKLIAWCQTIHNEGVTTELSSKILIAFVNQITLKEIDF